jgi:uncharacterized protein (DUF58 family)
VAGSAHASPSKADGKAAAQILGLESAAHGLADALPDLVAEAMRISLNVSHGIHGRRRAGPGETFWQFRQYQPTDAATLVDWRRSASSDHLFVREREWEAAHTIWLWPDLSRSMAFKSHLSNVTKRDRVLVLTLAAAELLVRGGERVGLLGLTKANASRKAARRLAEAIASNLTNPLLEQSLPPAERLTRLSGVLLVSDFLDPLPDIETRLSQLAASNVFGHLIQVLDPAEETLPYDGRTEFTALEGDDRWVADRVESLRPQYLLKLAAHRAGLEAIARKLGWSLLTHRTDRPAAEPLLALIMRMQAGGKDYRWSGRAGGAP